MLNKRPILIRIIVAFVLMTLTVSSVFSLAIFKVCHYMEAQIVSKDLDQKILNYAHAHSGSQSPSLSDSASIYTADKLNNSIPEKWRNLKPGFTEIIDGKQSFHAFRRNVDGKEYLLVRDQGSLEIYEQALFDGVVAGFILSILAATLIGWLLAKKLTAPIIQLAAQVRQRDPVNPSLSAMAAEHRQDEIGQLAHAFDSTLNQLNMALQRERLFTSDVSHELRSSLMIITVASEMLASAVPSNSKQLDYVQRISAASENMHNLVQTFLVLARSKNEESRICKRASLLTVAETQFKKWLPECEAKGLRLTLVEEKPSTQLYNATFLDTVFSNLLRNAMHYTERGAITITLMGDQFSVEDTGIGIPAAQQSSIFDPFVRVNQSLGEGIGIGLSLVQRVCNHQGWKVSMQPVLSQGSIFTVNLAPISP